MSYVLINQIERIRDEYLATRAAVGYSIRSWDMIYDSEEMVGRKLAHLRQADENLEGTYLVRLFARFEALLREQYVGVKPGAAALESASALVDQIGSAYRVPPDVRERVHLVRRRRNAIAHEDPGAETPTFLDAVAYLNRYLSWFPTPPA